MNLESFQIAGWARLYQLLSRRPELRSPDRERRIYNALIDNSCGLHLFDAALVIGASDLDRLCGYAVTVLRRRMSADVVDLLATIDPERICGLYYALPPERRRSVLKHGDWACCGNRANEGEVEQALMDINYLVEDTPNTELARAIAVFDLGGEFELPASFTCLA